jgi:hypothetical protein
MTFDDATTLKSHTSCHVATMSKKQAKGEYIETVRPLIFYFTQLLSFQLHSSFSQTNLGWYRLTPPQDTGNKVSRRSQIIGTTNIILGGKTVIQAEVIIRGDLLRTYPASNSSEKQGNPVAVAIGRYCFFSKGCELRPPGKLYKGYGCPLLSLFFCGRCDTELGVRSE